MRPNAPLHAVVRGVVHVVVHACYQDAPVLHAWYQDAGGVVCGRDRGYGGMGL